MRNCCFLSHPTPFAPHFVPIAFHPFFANINIYSYQTFSSLEQQVTVQLEHPERQIIWQTVLELEVRLASATITRDAPFNMRCTLFRLALICASCASAKMDMQRWADALCLRKFSGNFTLVFFSHSRHVALFCAHHHPTVNPFVWAHHAVNSSAWTTR